MIYRNSKKPRQENNAVEARKEFLKHFAPIHSLSGLIPPLRSQLHERANQREDAKGRDAHRPRNPQYRAHRFTSKFHLQLTTTVMRMTIHTAIAAIHMRTIHRSAGGLTSALPARLLGYRETGATGVGEEERPVAPAVCRGSAAALREDALRTGGQF